MDMVKVESSNVEEIGYDSGRAVLRVKFRGRPGVRQGGVYEYRNVTAEEHEQIMQAPSKGKMLLALVTSRPASRPFSRVE